MQKAQDVIREGSWRQLTASRVVKDGEGVESRGKGKSKKGKF